MWFYFNFYFNNSRSKNCARLPEARRLTFDNNQNVSWSEKTGSPVTRAFQLHRGARWTFIRHHLLRGFSSLKPPPVKLDLLLRGGRASSWSACSLVLALFWLMTRRINTTVQLPHGEKVKATPTSPVELFLAQVLLLDVCELIGQPLVFTSVLTHPAVQHSHLCCQCLQNSSRFTWTAPMSVKFAPVMNLQIILW